MIGKNEEVFAKDAALAVAKTIQVAIDLINPFSAVIYRQNLILPNLSL
jgi:hypothetical protein